MISSGLLISLHALVILYITALQKLIQEVICSHVAILSSLIYDSLLHLCMHFNLATCRKHSLSLVMSASWWQKTLPVSHIFNLQLVKHPQLNKGSSAQHNRMLENSMYLLPLKVSRLGDTEEKEPREPWGLRLQFWPSDSGN